MEKQAPEIFFIDEGNGEAIVLLHGFLETHEIWNNYIEKLSGKYRVLAIDLPGHGRSSVLGEELSMDQIAEEVFIILEILGIHKCILVGHSMGGYAAIQFAAKYSRLLKGLVLFHTQVEADTEEEKMNRDRTIRIVEQDHLDFVSNFTIQLFAPENVEPFKKEIDFLKTIAINTPKEGVIAALQGMKNRQDNLETLKKLRIPVLLIAGDMDSRIPVEKVKKQVEQAPKVRLEILHGVGHMGFVEAELETLKLIRNFADSNFIKKNN
ncbi:alpha/beta fold hydrolase [Bacteroidota bacterium]